LWLIHLDRGSKPQRGGSVGQSWGLLGDNPYEVTSSNSPGCYFPLGATTQA
jgi:hypothetical protein